MDIKDKIIYYQEKGVAKTEAIKKLAKEFGASEVYISKLWLEIREANFVEEDHRRKRGTGRQVKATSEDRIYCRAIATYGEENQKRIAQEELAELIQAISKDLRGRPHNVEEEIADVEIVLEQLKKMYNKQRVNKWKLYKLKKLKNKLGGE